MKTILAPVDFSSVSRRVVDAAIALAKEISARVVLVHVIPKPTFIRNALPAVEDVEMRTKSLARQADKQLLELQGLYRKKLSDVETLQLSGPAPTRIVEEARSRKAAYIVLGSHGHSAVRDALVGSVAAAVVKTAPCPVLLVPPTSVSVVVPRRSPGKKTETRAKQLASR